MQACLMDLATAITGALLSHSCSPGDALLLEEITKNIWVSFCSHSSQIPQVWTQNLLLLTLPLCVQFMAAYFMFLGYQRQSIGQQCQHPTLPLSTVGDINPHQLVGFGHFWAGLFFRASKQDFQGFQERQTFAHIGKKNKLRKQVVLNWPENIPAQPQTGFASLCCIDDKGKICRAICS